MQQELIVILIVCLVGYRIIRRVRSQFQWIELRPRRLGFRIALFAAIGVLFMAEGGMSAVGLVSDALGILIGAALGIVGASMTAFERRGGELHYRGNAWIGGVVTALFVGRLVYRIYFALASSTGGDWNSADFFAAGSSWTSGLALIMFAYYVVYYALLLKQRGQATVRAR
ncbi:DUF1453 family protein [Paenibacillus glycinis]|uniref:DUF1453 family protein n=1 Tax=Paenibacillus glycinis TaxID=2697035 RepID=A0ABW9XNM7_9BACL|nr:DUF1453 family protein [Paenibacillus glycinis]NBD24123.1 DUF1453 family protein [Paenibacillus glycinis]